MTVDSHPVGPPTLLRLPRQNGENHVLTVARLPADHDARDYDIRLLTAAGATILRAGHHGADGVPVLEPEELVSPLTPEGRRRIFRHFLETVGVRFQLPADPDYIRLCRRFMALLQPRALPLTRMVSLSPDFIFGRVSSDRLTGAPVSAVLIDETVIRRNPLRPTRLGPSLDGRGVELEVILARRKSQGRQSHLLIFDDRANLEVCTVGSGGQELLPYLQSLPADAAIRVRNHLLASLKPFLGRDETLRAGLREALALFPEAPRPILPKGRPLGAGIDALVRTEDGGLFAKGWRVDPLGLMAALTLISPSGTRIPLDINRFQWPEPEGGVPAHPDRTSFIAHAGLSPEPLPGGAYRFEVRLRSGTTLMGVTPMPPADATAARGAVLGSLPAQKARGACMAEAIAPAVASLQRTHLSGPRVRHQDGWGEPAPRPRVSVVVPLYRNLEFLRPQMAALAMDPDRADIDLIYVLDSPEQEEELVHRLRQLFIVYALPFRLLIHGRNHGYAPAVNTGAGAARGDFLMLLNSDVIPARAGWLPAMVQAAEANLSIGVVGPKLLFADDSVQHAGLYFAPDDRGRWYNRHFFKGYPRDYKPLNVAREVPGVTGACALVGRALFERVGGITEDYVVGDYEDSDFCLKIRREGRSCWYLPQVELYHFERQSIQLHEGYTKTLASEYNQWLHSSRWLPDMAALMAGEDRWRVPLNRGA
ncbi:glycosyltransferase family 2 protein [Azospirillum sp.]|uniref:glycosyltransferase family 2 protein n=1 Tax=Azospirillum sp. TaxID=34012 RepID=UPI002D472D53|nr:glycosyltransferase family 2 protein [Azospirillum sp.]HYD66543.1 glycosyltransferase family 2 protein [Azospirillum sp.]